MKNGKRGIHTHTCSIALSIALWSFVVDKRAKERKQCVLYQYLPHCYNGGPEIRCVKDSLSDTQAKDVSKNSLSDNAVEQSRKALLSFHPLKRWKLFSCISANEGHSIIATHTVVAIVDQFFCTLYTLHSGALLCAPLWHKFVISRTNNTRPFIILWTHTHTCCPLSGANANYCLSLRAFAKQLCKLRSLVGRTI